MTTRNDDGRWASPGSHKFWAFFINRFSVMLHNRPGKGPTAAAAIELPPPSTTAPGASKAARREHIHET